jgi:hypothetical protein
VRQQTSLPVQDDEPVHALAAASVMPRMRVLVLVLLLLLRFVLVPALALVLLPTGVLPVGHVLPVAQANIVTCAFVS